MENFMSERIRYKNINGTLESVQVLKHPTNGAQYIIRIVPPNAENTAFQWMILDNESEIIAVSGKNNKKHITLKEIRVALKELGVIVAVGSRKKRTQTVA
jgi:hypothetical protein